MRCSSVGLPTDHRHVGVVHVLGDVLLRRVLAGGDVDRDAVVGPRDFVGQERLVVEGVVPRAAPAPMFSYKALA